MLKSKYSRIAMLILPLCIYCFAGFGISGCSSDEDMKSDPSQNLASIDEDGDGFSADEDCDDSNASIYPGASDLPDSDYIDSNCDGMDGNPLLAIWVSADEGNDAAGLGTIDNPVKSIKRGMELAALKTASERHVYVVLGKYAEDLHVTGGVNIYGGYGPLSEGMRERDIDIYAAEVTGVDNSLSTVLNFHGGPMEMHYTVFLDNTESIVDGLHITGDVSGMCVIIVNSDATVSNNRISDSLPAVVKHMAITVAAFVNDSAVKDHRVELRGNNIFMRGVGGVSPNSDPYTNIGVIAYPEANADHSLEVVVAENRIESSGICDEAYAVIAADDDTDPTDDPNGDLKSNIDLKVLNNFIKMKGLYQGVIGVMAGTNVLANFGPPSAEELTQIGSLNVSGNYIHMDLNGSEGASAVSAAYVREDAVAANNVFFIEGNVLMAFGIVGYHSAIDAVHNTMHFDTVGNQLLGIAMLSSDTVSPGPWYVNTSPLRVANNILSFSHQASSPSCIVMALSEHVTASADSYVNASSPEEVLNNDIYIDSNCANLVYYLDKISTAASNTVASLADLNGKTGFRGDDPSVISGNFGTNPLFSHTANGDFSLKTSSPCIDAGADVGTGWLDILGIPRPAGGGFDVGAYER